MSKGTIINLFTLHSFRGSDINRGSRLLFLPTMANKQNDTDYIIRLGVLMVLLTFFLFRLLLSLFVPVDFVGLCAGLCTFFIFDLIERNLYK